MDTNKRFYITLGIGFLVVFLVFLAMASTPTSNFAKKISATKCYDSDGGITPEVIGICKYNNVEFRDYCTEGQLTEYYCGKGGCLTKTILCPIECSIGECVNTSHMECYNEQCIDVLGSGVDECASNSDCISDSCYDSDGGVNKLVLGYVTYSPTNETNWDYCLSNTTICELLCSEEGEPVCYVDTSCPIYAPICQNGACTNSTINAKE